MIGRPMNAFSNPRAVPIVLTGARPGEKLYEELSYEAELLEPTTHPGITAFADDSIPDPEVVDQMVKRLDFVRASKSRTDVIDAIADHIPSLPSAALSSSGIGIA